MFEILLISPNLGGGGAQRVVTNLANGWSRQGRRVALLTLSNAQDAYPLDPGVTRFRLDCSQPENLVNRVKSAQPAWEPLLFAISTRLYKMAYDLPSLWPLLSWFLPQLRLVLRLRRTIETIEAGVVVSFLGSTNVQTIMACTGLGRRVVISERNDPSVQQLHQPWEALRRHAYNDADLVTADSRGVLQAMSSYVDHAKLAFAPNPLTALTHHVGCDLDGPFILIVARLHPQKAHDILLPAFARLVAQLPEWRLAMVGQGDCEEKLRELARDLALGDRVVWCGPVRDPFPYYRKASIFVLPSRHEGMPNALLEALSCGLPAIVSNASPGPLELVVDGQNGLVVPAEDIEALSNAMLRLAGDRRLRDHLALQAKDSVADYEFWSALKTWAELVELR
jgi:glycosyltransferase involved in cell wall biosynthesis